MVEGDTLVVTQQMVESRSMVNGASPGPAPACHARAGNSRLTRSSWRTWPHRKLRRKVPRVDGALTMPPSVQAVSPVRNTSASSMQSPPAMAEATRGITCRRCGPSGSVAQVEVFVHQFTQTETPSQGGGRHQPGIGHQAVIVEGDIDAVGVVTWQHLLGAPFPGSVFCFKTIIPDAQEHLLDASGR